MAHRVPRLATLAVLMLSLGLLVATPGPAAQAAAGASSAPIAACATAQPGHVRCFALWRPASASAKAAPSTTTGGVGRPSKGFGPADLAAAYQLPKTGGSGQTIAIVDAFDNPKVESDLNKARAAFGLKPCTTANGCFRKVNQAGGSKPPTANADWGVEIALDVTAVSYTCPNCHILLVEANDTSVVNMGIAVNRAVAMGATVVSNSYGINEYKGAVALGKKYFTHPGVAMVAATGDFGYIDAQFPAAMPTTIAVGGTSLTRSGSAWKEKAWDRAGSGCSKFFAKPAWQKDTKCKGRTTADLSVVADTDTPLAVYDTFGLGKKGGWITGGGTSASAPLVAGMIGLAGNSKSLTSAQRVYAHVSSLRDVVGGSNGLCGGTYLCTAVKGYDGPTGLGSPRGLGAL